MKKGLKVALILIGMLLLILVIYAVYVFRTYYRLPDKLTLEVSRNGGASWFEEEALPAKGIQYSIMTYNIGFGAYTPDFTFFMDGGKSSWAKDEESVIAGVSGIGEYISDRNPDFALIQEVDKDGTRSYHVDETSLLNQFLKGYYYIYAQNYDSPFLLFPPWQPHGANKAGMITYSKPEITEAMRRSLPIAQTLRKLIDLDRCYSISRIPMEGGGKLCIYNVHLSAYGNNDSIREGQISMLFEDMLTDYNNGNHIICGGDFNHDLKAAMDEKTQEAWAVPFPRESIPEGLRLAIDEAGKEDISHNSARNNDKPYDRETSYTVTLDSFIVSDNVKVVSYQNVDFGYKNSDHDPVIMEFILE